MIESKKRGRPIDPAKEAGIKHCAAKLFMEKGYAKVSLDQIAKSAADNNWSGIITNGYIRDIEVIKSIKIGVLAKNSYPKKTDKSIGKSEIGAPISIGSINIKSGDWVYVDLNGWVISDSELKF